MVTDNVLFCFFACLKRLCYNGVMARCLLLVFPATNFEKIGSCTVTAAGPRRRRRRRCVFVFRHVLGNARIHVQELYSGFRRDCRRVLGGGWKQEWGGGELRVCVFTLMIDSAVKQCN